MIRSGLLTAVLAANLLSCAQVPLANAEPSDNGQLLGYNLTLAAENNECILYYDNKKFHLALKPPCYFLKRDNKIQYYAYPNQSVDASFAVIDNQMSESDKQAWPGQKNKGCGTSMRGLTIKNNAVHLSPYNPGKGLLCRNSGSDEKLFWMAAHPEKLKGRLGVY